MKKLVFIIAIAGIMLVSVSSAHAQLFSKSEVKASVAGISKGEITKEKLLNSATIECSDLTYEIIYFNLSVLRKNGDLVVYAGRGNSLSESMKAEIKALEPGTKLVLEDIGARSAENKFIELTAIVLDVK